MQHNLLSFALSSTIKTIHKNQTAAKTIMKHGKKIAGMSIRKKNKIKTLKHATEDT